MKKYSAVVKNEYNRTQIIANKEYYRKSDFIKDLRSNGYKVNPKKVKESKLFDYIMRKTNCYPWDWEIKSIPSEE